jgi:hypothetical protein
MGQKAVKQNLRKPALFAIMLNWRQGTETAPRQAHELPVGEN